MCKNHAFLVAGDGRRLGIEAKTSIGRYLEFYNSIRPHSSLKALTPDQVYFKRLPESMAT